MFQTCLALQNNFELFIYLIIYYYYRRIIINNYYQVLSTRKHA